METTLNQEIESLIDSNNLRAVLYAISEVCVLKSEHIDQNWQDTGLAKAWSACAKRIDTLTEKLPDIGGISK